MRALSLAALVVVAGCTTSRTIGQPNLSVREDTINLSRHNKVDILFVVADSPGMGPQEDALRRGFPELVARLRTLASSGVAASFHIGVITSDLGAGPFVDGACHPGGDGAVLRGCAALSGVPFIDYDSATGVTNMGTTDLATALDCMAAVGQTGCIFGHPLEAAYRALTTPSLNPGFLRDDALLVVAFVTNADDCSAPPDSSLFDPSAAGIATWGALDSFRCTRFGVVCDGLPLGGGDFSSSNCAPATGGPLFDVARYTQLFAAGGVKADPSDALLVAFAAPPAPVTVAVTTPCPDVAGAASCPILQPSCVSMTDATLVGDPAVRIDAVVGSTVNAVSTPICNDDAGNLDAMADAISARLKAGCLPGAVVDVTDPGCTVFVGGQETPRCTYGGRLPCWDVVVDMGCPARMTPAGATQHFRFVVEGTSSTVSATCPLYEPAT